MHRGLACVFLAATLSVNTVRSADKTWTDEQQILLDLLLPAISEVEGSCPPTLLQSSVETVEALVTYFFAYGYCYLPPDQQYLQLGVRLMYDYSKALQGWLIANNATLDELPQACDFRYQIDELVGHLEAYYDGSTICVLDSTAPWAQAPAPTPTA